MNAHMDSELDTFILLQTAIEVSHGSKNSQTSPYCSLGVIFMCLGIAEVHEESIPEELGDMPIVALDNFRTSRLIGTDDFPVLFGVELGGKFSGIDQVAEHDGELAAFRVRCTRAYARRCWLDRGCVLDQRHWDRLRRRSRCGDSPFNSTC